MQHKFLKIFLTGSLGFLLPLLSYAYPLTSPNYQMQTGVLDSGGGYTISSTNFRIEAGSLGQPIIGESTSASYTLQGGFVPASEAKGEPNPPSPGAIPEFPTRLAALIVGILAFGGYLGLRVWKKSKSKKQVI